MGPSERQRGVRWKVPDTGLSQEVFSSVSWDAAPPSPPSAGGFSYCETRVLWTGAFARRKLRALLPSVPKAAPSVWDLLPILMGSALPCCKLASAGRKPDRPAAGQGTLAAFPWPCVSVFQTKTCSLLGGEGFVCRGRRCPLGLGFGVGRGAASGAQPRPFGDSATGLC